jgi:biotin synthase
LTILFFAVADPVIGCEIQKKRCLYMKEYIRGLERLILVGQAISFEDAMRLSELEDKKHIEELCSAEDRIREHFCGNEADRCTLMNARSGRCSEDCKFCAQSSRYKTCAEEYGVVSSEAAVAAAKENEYEGVNRFSLVTSGRSVCGDDLEKVLEIYEALGNKICDDKRMLAGIGFELRR